MLWNIGNRSLAFWSIRQVECGKKRKAGIYIFEKAFRKYMCGYFARSRSHVLGISFGICGGPLRGWSCLHRGRGVFVCVLEASRLGVHGRGRFRVYSRTAAIGTPTAYPCPAAKHGGLFLIYRRLKNAPCLVRVGLQWAHLCDLFYSMWRTSTLDTILVVVSFLSQSH